jgi:alkaline phosphatase D
MNWKNIVLSLILATTMCLSNTLVFYYPSYAAQTNDLTILNGVASGDSTDHSAIIWSRANRDSFMHVQYTYNSFHFSNSDPIVTVPANASSDFTGHAKLTALKPNTNYRYVVWFSLDPNQNDRTVSQKLIGSFTTAPDLKTSETISFVIGGDLGASKQCRRPEIGYPIFSVMKSLSPDFFIFNGDQIYADNDCPAEGPNPSNIKSGHLIDFPGWRNIPGDFLSVKDRKVNWTNETQLHNAYLGHWDYNRNDQHLQSLLSNTSMYSQADDHEVIDDYGKWEHYINGSDHGFPNLVKAGIKEFFDFSPIDRSKTEPNRIYKTFHWGKDLDLLLSDARSYRSRSEIPDTPQNDKTLLGKEQLQWLEEGLKNSNATWKVVSLDVPMTIPNCFNKNLGCDNWATDSAKNNKTYTRERNEFIKFLDDNRIKNVIFVATDVHFAANVKYDDDPNHDGHNLTFYEMVNGPLNTWTNNVTNPTDPTIKAHYSYNESAIFNFGYVTIKKLSDGKSHLISEVIDSNGRIRPKSILNLTEQPSVTEEKITPPPKVISTDPSAREENIMTSHGTDRFSKLMNSPPQHLRHLPYAYLMD